MKNAKLQLMMHGNEIGNNDKVTINYPGVKVEKVWKVENANYLFVDLTISPVTKPGTVKIGLFRKGLPVAAANYELKTRSKENGKTRVQGVVSTDVVYLLIPDRFANGDPTNDIFPDMRDTQHDRNNPFDRHGGDLQGVIDHLDYLHALGVTTVWLTPVIENDMTRTQEGGVSRSTYHGYAFTDHYNIDKRLGGNGTYKKLIDAAHAKGMKVVQDAVYNHVGSDHWFIRDMPMLAWVNQWPQYTSSSYRSEPLMDPYASTRDKKLAVGGWFTPFMPDLDQRNPYVVNFLIQYAIWTTEEFGIDGWRVDTYFYNEQSFLNKINEALLREFPQLTIVGEAWVPSVVNSAFFVRNRLNHISFRHNLRGVTDFPVYFALKDALTQPADSTEGVKRLYMTLAHDLVYQDPTRNWIFLDNHDLDRVYSVVGENFARFKMGINWLLTLRGIPQLYYGTEILMKNFTKPSDAEVRQDFPGGWSGDAVNQEIPQSLLRGYLVKGRA
jgi:glycosidase